MAETIKRGIAGAVVIAAWSLTPGAAQATQPGWYENFKQAAQESHRSQKPMLIKFSAEWCGPCKRMSKTFEDEEVVSHVECCFVPVSLDADRETELVETIGIETLPATVIISPEFQVIKKITGYKTPQQLHDELGAICKDNCEAAAAAEQAAHLVLSPIPHVDCDFGGCCLVTLLDEQILAVGSSAFVASYRGRQVCFASEDHLRRFQGNPDKYWPVLDGYCPVSAIERRELRLAQPEWGAIYCGRVWFFADPEHRQRFAESPLDYFAPLAAEAP